MDALVGFGGGTSRRASFARQKSTDQTSNKDKKSKEEKEKENESDSESEEDEEKKLLNNLIGNLGIVDPMTGNNKRNMSRRGSRVPAG